MNESIVAKVMMPIKTDMEAWDTGQPTAPNAPTKRQ